MNRLITALLLACLASTALGEDTRLEQINAIKKNADYLYGEATLATKADATSLAYELLQKEVFGWAQNDSIQLKVTSVTDINRLARVGTACLGAQWRRGWLRHKQHDRVQV